MLGLILKFEKGSYDSTSKIDKATLVHNDGNIGAVPLYDNCNTEPTKIV